MGFFVEHMVCGMSGEHKLAINKTIDSCTDVCTRSDADVVGKSCCDYDSFYFKDDVPATTVQKTVKKTISSFSFKRFSESRFAVKCKDADGYLPFQEPDELVGVDTYILYQTFLI